MLSAIAERAIEPDDMVHQTTITTLAARAAKSLTVGGRLRTGERCVVVSSLAGIAWARSVTRSTASTSMGCEIMASMAALRYESSRSSSQLVGIRLMTILQSYEDVLLTDCRSLARVATTTHFGAWVKPAGLSRRILTLSKLD